MTATETSASAEILGLTATNGREIVNRIRAGLSPESARNIEQHLGLTHAQLAALLGMPERSFARRLRAERLSASESDVLYRIARTYALARHTLGEQKAMRWLNKPNRALGGEAPLRLLDTEAGAREVEDLLGRILYGVYS